MGAASETAPYGKAESMKQINQNPDLNANDQFFADVDPLSHGNNVGHILAHYKVIARESFGIPAGGDSITMLKLLLSPHFPGMQDLDLSVFEENFEDEPIEAAAVCKSLSWETFNDDGTSRNEGLVPEMVDELLIRITHRWYFTIWHMQVEFTDREEFAAHFANSQQKEKLKWQCT